MSARPIAFALLAGTSLLPGTTTSDRLDLLEAKVSRIENLLEELTNTRDIKPSRPNSPVNSSIHYQVRKGDSYWSIARRHKISVTALEKANPGVNPRALSIGKKINIPGGGRGHTSHHTSNSNSGTYQVKPGDILGRISEAHGIRLHQLIAANPGLDPRRLRIGKILTIPGRQSIPTPQERPPAPSKEPSPVNSPIEDPPDPELETRPRNNPFLSDPESFGPEVRQLDDEEPPILIEEPRIVTVEKDLRLSQIAERYKTTVARINQLNNRELSPKQMIKEGSELYIPAR